MVLKYQEQESTARSSVPDAPIDNAYIVGCSGFIYTGASIVSEETWPPSAALIVSAGPAPFKILVKGQELLTRAAVIPPFLARGLDARAVPLVCFHITPSSPLYVEFRALAHGRVVFCLSVLFSKVWMRHCTLSITAAWRRRGRLKSMIRRCVFRFST